MLSSAPSTKSICWRQPSIARLRSSGRSSFRSRTDTFHSLALSPFQTHERTRSARAPSNAPNKATSCVDTTKVQSGRVSSKAVKNGSTIARCRCRSGSSISTTVPGSTVNTLAATIIALRSPSDNSAILYGCSPFRCLARNLYIVLVLQFDVQLAERQQVIKASKW